MPVVERRDPGTPDLSSSRHLHIVGIGGAGMSAIAVVLVGLGHRVSGSDLKDSRLLERLGLLGVDARVGHDAANVAPSVDAVVVSTAVPSSNPEVRAAVAAGVPVLRRAEMLAAIVARTRGIAVAGSHGKTTTASMLALVLRSGGLHPSFIIGGELNEVGTNAALDCGEWLVVEADESDGTFLVLEPEAVLVTNVEPDHLDYYGDFDRLVAAFATFLARAPGSRMVCADDPVARRLAATVGGARTYGFAESADYRIVDYEGGRTGSRFRLVGRGRDLGPLELPVPGRHNALNAAGATALALELGVDIDSARRALAGFGGVARRFEVRGTRGGVTLVDDYAHLPSEVAAAIAAAREGRWRRVHVVFQPHRYSRTERLGSDFRDAFVEADTVILTDVYPAGEHPRPGVSGRLLLRAVLDAHPTTRLAYFPRRAELLDALDRYARPGDLVLTLGAGDLTTLPDEWLARV